MPESNFRISSNKMTEPDPFFDSLFDSLLDSLHAAKSNNPDGLEEQDPEKISEMIFSESSETVGSINVEDHILSPGSESGAATAVSESETEGPPPQDNFLALSEKIDPLSATFFVGLASEITSSLNKTKEYARLAERSLPDNGATRYFYQIAKDIDKIERLLDVYIKFHRINTPTRKANTVHTIIEKLVKKHGDKLKEKNVRLFRRFENGLPEIIVHDKQFEYILDHLLLCIIGLISPNAGITFSTKSRTNKDKIAQGQQVISHRDAQYVYISLVITDCLEPAKHFGKKLSFQHHQQGEILTSLMMRFVEETVSKNQGILRVEADEVKKQTFFIMRFSAQSKQAEVYVDVL